MTLLGQITFGGPAPNASVASSEHELILNRALLQTKILNVHMLVQAHITCNHGNDINMNFLCGQENVWKGWGLHADWLVLQGRAQCTICTKTFIMTRV